MPQFTILTRGNDTLSSHNRKVRSIFNRILKDRDIRVHPNSEVLKSMYDYRHSGDGNSRSKKSSTREKCSYLQCTNGEKYVYDESIWCTSASHNLAARQFKLSLG